MTDATICGKPGPKRGYRQTPEHRQAISEAHRRRGDWKGDAALERSGRTRALRKFPDIGSCVDCGNSRAERHHLDENTLNNDPENIAALCRRCHMMRDGRLANIKRVRAAVINPGGKPRFTASEAAKMAGLASEGWSQSRIAELFGTTQSVVSRIVNGKRKGYTAMLERTS